MRACMHTYTTDITYSCTHITFKRPQKTSRLDRRFLFGMAVRSGLNVKIYRTPILTTRPQCGGRASSRSHVANALLRQPERMADRSSLLWKKSYRQDLFWKFLYVCRCRSLSSTSSLISGISCSPVRRRMSILVANRLLPPLAPTHRMCVCRSRRRKYRRKC